MEEQQSPLSFIWHNMPGIIMLCLTIHTAWIYSSCFDSSYTQLLFTIGWPMYCVSISAFYLSLTASWSIIQPLLLFCLYVGSYSDPKALDNARFCMGHHLYKDNAQPYTYDFYLHCMEDSLKSYGRCYADPCENIDSVRNNKDYNITVRIVKNRDQELLDRSHCIGKLFNYIPHAGLKYPPAISMIQLFHGMIEWLHEIDMNKDFWLSGISTCHPLEPDQVITC